MIARQALPATMAMAVVLISYQAAHGQTNRDQPFGQDRSGDRGASPQRPSAGAGYSYVAPSYRIAWTPAYFGGYAGLPRFPLYLSTTRAPQLNFIQPQYQSAYQFDRGGPAFGITPLTLYDLRLANRVLLRPSLGDLAIRSGKPVYRTYVTASQYVYSPTYFSAASAPADLPSGAVYGAYGYAAVYGD